MDLTPKQKRVLDFITEYRLANGYAPSQMEIARRFRLKSLGSVQNYLVRLERCGALSRTWNARRGLKLAMPISEAGEAVLELSLVGHVAAGKPLEALENPEPFAVPRGLIAAKAGRLRREDYFVLQAVGESMVEEGILSGDYVVIRRQETAESGDTVVALLDNEATIKKWVPHKDHIELHPANPAYEPLVIAAAEAEARGLRIAGILVGVMRKVWRD